ncbi:MAG: adenylate/guanylate cyclase domain-containing protein, partial [Planctomycetota bacterium]
MPGSERRLAAILFSDIVGYTALMARDEAAGLRARERHRQLLGTQAARYHGRVVDENGDELVLVFPSDLDAVNCALAAQGALRGDPELALRIGIHAGDVIFDADHVYGDGVNVASRIRPLAEPGGVCVSDPVYESVKNQPHVEATPLGEKELKNVPRPLAVFALRGTPVEPAETSRPRFSKLTWALALGAAATVALAALAWWALQWAAPAPIVDRRVPASLVVLPFDDL